MNCILAQRLLRLICPRCRRPVKIPPEVLSSSGIDTKKHKNVAFYEGAGCDECYHTGFRRRKAIVEILDLTDEIRDMIASKRPLSDIKKRAMDEGMVGLRQGAVGCAIRGERNSYVFNNKGCNGHGAGGGLTCRASGKEVRVRMAIEEVGPCGPAAGFAR
jgi:type II secretory ATPase GspE/PulE/Tfp pilus assembly ATPase PilB-like protein